MIRGNVLAYEDFYGADSEQQQYSLLLNSSPRAPRQRFHSNSGMMPQAPNSPLRADISRSSSIKSCMSVRSLEDSLGCSLYATRRPSTRSSASSIVLPPDVTSWESGGSSGVSFHAVEVREYKRQLGDQLCATSGPPIGIGWEYRESKKVRSVDEYERIRGPKRRKSLELHLPRRAREEILQDFGVARSEMDMASKETEKNKRDRLRSANRAKFQWIEEGVESAKRKLKGIVRRKSKDEDLYASWVKAEHERAAAEIRNLHYGADVPRPRLKRSSSAPQFLEIQLPHEPPANTIRVPYRRRSSLTRANAA